MPLCPSCAQDFLNRNLNLGIEWPLMPCPYFMPSQATSLASLPHPERLPLGNAYAGRCTAANLTPTEAMLHDCNLGYANCKHLPTDRSADAVRFSVRRDQNASIAICYVFEAAYAPVARGELIYDTSALTWRQPHADSRIQRMAECCVASFHKEE